MHLNLVFALNPSITRYLTGSHSGAAPARRQNPERKRPFHFKTHSTPAEQRCMGSGFFRGCRSFAAAGRRQDWCGIRAYLVSSHHSVRGACESFGIAAKMSSSAVVYCHRSSKAGLCREAQRLLAVRVGLERHSDVSRVRETASQGRENLLATASKLFLTAPHSQHKTNEPDTEVTGDCCFIAESGTRKILLGFRSAERNAKLGSRNFLVRRDEKMFLTDSLPRHYDILIFARIHFEGRCPRRTRSVRSQGFAPRNTFAQRLELHQS